MPGGLGLLDGDGGEAEYITRARLTGLPKGARRYGVGVDEAAEGEPVGSKDDRRLATQINRAKAIAVFDDVRWMGAVFG